MNTKGSIHVTRAKKILAGEKDTPQELLALAKRLKGENAFGYARKILARARENPSVNADTVLRQKLTQQYALCTYKDPDLPMDERLDRAFKILQETCDPLNTTRDQETLGIAGAIHKRKWEMDAQKQHLERSLAYYLRGYNVGVTSDDGYTGINAAFVLDLLAQQEDEEAEKAGTQSKSAADRRDEAREIRKTIISQLSGKAGSKPDWWLLVTLAEAYLGVGLYQEALDRLKDASSLPNIVPWEFESTARQLAALARLHQKRGMSMAQMEESPAWGVLRDFLKGSEAGVRSAFIGKVGLALSGGGFRAALFHIGVLAKLAELDILRHVEVLSCVSGGSIIGAHYYLELRKLLEKPNGGKIDRIDYINIVHQIAKDFLAGVQTNIRTRVAADLVSNLKMIFSPNTYSRTQRLGELFEKHIFSRIADGGGTQNRWINNLFVEPMGPEGQKIQNFDPKYDNWDRAAKVPMLILNATTLNTGHNWQFTASFMGEPPGSINTEVDANRRLRRMYYWEAPTSYQQIRLGHAVAASACVPGLFDPITLPELYPNLTVRLVDGGVHDNQGIAGLLEQDCTVLLVSDGSGQMETENEPSKGFLGVPLRSSTISMDRVRGAQYREVDARRRSSLLRGLMFVHLKKDLDTDPLDWIGCDNPGDSTEEARHLARRRTLTNYGIRRDLQTQLAAIRTDLDSFSDIEAFALMMSGYRMTEHEMAAFPEFQTHAGDRQNWCFLQIEGLMNRPEAYKDFTPILRIASQTAFKVWRLVPWLRITALTLGATAFVGLLWVCWHWASVPLLTLGQIGIFIGTLAAGAVVGKKVMRIVRVHDTLLMIATGIGMALFGSLAAGIHLGWFDRWYLRLGAIDRLLKEEAKRHLPSAP